MSVDVGAGLALIQFTTTLLSPNETVKSWLNSDAVINVSVPAADLTNPRKDRIVAKFDTSVDPNTAASNIVSIELVQGTPAGSPSLPALPANGIHLKTVNVAAGATSITNANLADTPDYVTLDTAVLADVVRHVELASTATGKGASLIGVEDAVGNYTATNLEAVLAEISVNIAAGNVLFGDGSDGALNVTSGTTTIDATGAVDGVLIKQYTSFNVSVGATLAFSNVPSGGLTFVVLSQGNYTMAGALSLGSCGAVGVSGSTISKTSNGLLSSNANTGTDSNLRIGQTRKGGAGNAGATTSGGSTVNAAATGGGGAANSVNDGTVSLAATAGTASAAAATAGAALTMALLRALANGFNLSLAPGASGGTGGVAIAIDNYSSGTFTATSGASGRGGGSCLVMCGGDYSMTGTVNTSGAASVAASTSNGSATNYALAAGGSAGGAAGSFLACVRGSIVSNSGTYTVTAGSGDSGSTLGSGTHNKSATSSGNSADGVALVVHVAL